MRAVGRVIVPCMDVHKKKQKRCKKTTRRYNRNYYLWYIPKGVDTLYIVYPFWVIHIGLTYIIKLDN